MAVKATFVHTNLIARDWRKLAAFYEHVFGCTQVGHERHLSGPRLEAVTGIAAAEIHGVHLRLPGHGEEGPTLEIFGYTPQMDRQPSAPNRPGFAHIAFAVDDVVAARDEVVAAGGSAVGELVFLEVKGAGNVTFVYMADPEGNIIELQRWEREGRNSAH